MPTRAGKSATADLLTKDAASCNAAVFRRRLVQDFVFGYRQDPSLPLQLWLDAAADVGEVACRLQAVEIHRQALGAAGHTPEELWAHAYAVGLVPPPHEAEILAAGRLIETAEGLQKLSIDTLAFSFVCLLVLSYMHAPTLDLSSRGLDRSAIRLLRPSLAAMPRLEALRLQNNRLDGSCVAELISLKLNVPQLCWLDLAGNQVPEPDNVLVQQMVTHGASAQALACIQHRELTRRDWSRLSIDTPLQASLGHNSLRLAQRLATCHGLARVAGLDLSALEWRDLASLTAGLGALGGARSLWSLRLHLAPKPCQLAASGSWWGPALVQLARPPALRALHLDDSPLHADDVAAFARHLGGLKSLDLLIVSVGAPSWANDAEGSLAMAELAKIADREDIALTPAAARPEFGKLVPATDSLMFSGMPPPPLVMAENLHRACAAPVGLYLLYPPNALITPTNSKAAGVLTDGGELDSHLIHTTLQAQPLEAAAFAAIGQQRAIGMADGVVGKEEELADGEAA